MRSIVSVSYVIARRCNELLLDIPERAPVVAGCIQQGFLQSAGYRARLTSFGRDARGELYVTLQGGDVYRIVPN